MVPSECHLDLVSNERMNDESPRLGLLSITPELRAAILAYSIDFDRYHILDDGMIRCAAAGDSSWCDGPYECHGHAASTERAECRHCIPRAAPPVLMTCRLLRQEASMLVQQRQSVMCSWPSTMLRFLLHQPLATALSGQVYLACGPGKHGSHQENQATVQMLHILATSHPNLHGLHLVLRPYYGIYDDVVILRRRLLTTLSHFRHLRHFTLTMTPEPPGPLSIRRSPSHRPEMLQMKALRTQAAISRLLCAVPRQQTKHDPTSFLRNLKTALDDASLSSSTNESLL